MRMEFLDDIRPSVIRLYDYRPDEIRRLSAICVEVAEGRCPEFWVSAEPMIDGPVPISFLWWLGETDIGVAVGKDSIRLELSSEGWLEVRDKLKSLADNSTGGFQWIAGNGDIAVLVSQDGKW